MDEMHGEGEATSSKRTPKLRRSCETCRNSKGRCLPSDDPKRCQKCIKDGKTCVFLEAKPRPKRAKNSRGRVAEMEERLEGLLNLLAAQTGAIAPATSASQLSTSASQPDTPSASAQSSTPSSTRDQIDISMFGTGTNDTEFLPTFNFPSTSVQVPETFTNNNNQIMIPYIDRMQDVISRGLIDFAQAEQALRLFQANSDRFPFVLVPDGMSLDSLRLHRPFLLLTILAFAAASDEKLQRKLEREIRETLSRRLVINGEKSLDLLEGLLVYLAWYQFYFDMECQQLYRLSQMATSLAADLGINKPLRTTAAGMSKFCSARPSSLLRDISIEESEYMRVFLGCYYISSSICFSLRRPSNMKYSSYMKECAQLLAQAGQFETDRLLPYFVQVQRISEEVAQTFDYAANFELPPSDAVRVEALAKAFERQLSQVEASFTPEARNNVQLTMQFYLTRIHLSEVGFHATALPPQGETVSPQFKSRSWYHSSARNEILISCLQACKDYLDRFLLLKAENVVNCTLPDILGLVYAVLVLGTFAARVDSPNLDAARLREMANFEYYLNCLIMQITDILAINNRSGVNNYLHYIDLLFHHTRIWYTQTLADPSVDKCVPSVRTSLSFMDLINTIINRCADFGSLVTLPEAPTSEEQWTELLTEWTGSLETSNFLEGSLQQFSS